MAKSARFLFETDFDAAPAAEARRPAKAAAPPPPPSFSEAELEAARQVAIAEGRARGVAEAEGSVERAAATALEAVASELAGIGEAYRAGRAAEAEAALALAGAIARKIAPHLARTAPAGDIERFVAEQLSALIEEPRVVVRLAEGQADQLAERLGEIGRQAGYPGAIVVLGDDALEAGDCRIEWADGGAERLLARRLAELDDLVAAFLAAPAPAAVPADGSDTEPPAEE